MNKMKFYVTFILLFITGTLCIITPEKYEEIKNYATFEVLEYEKILHIFKDIKIGDAETGRKTIYEDEKYF
jgi:hypothetical protein